MWIGGVRVLVTMALAGAIATPVSMSAQSPSCGAQLMAVPLESLQLPDDLAFGTIDLAPSGSWYASADNKLGEEWNRSVTIRLECSADPALFLDRTLVLQTLSGMDALDPIEVGDEAVVLELRDESDGEYKQLYWRHGPIVGQLGAFNDYSVADLEAIALAVDALLPMVSQPPG